MPKINHEEYEVLKKLDDEWKWISKDEYSHYVDIFQVKPYKAMSVWLWNGHSEVEEIRDKDLFQFIQWEDEEPYNIQELIAEYVSHILEERRKILSDSLWTQLESEETEVKKDIEWLKDEIRKVGKVKHWIADESTVEIELPTLDYTINQLEERLVKPVIPEYVADYILSFDCPKKEILRQSLESVIKKNFNDEYTLAEEWINNNFDLFALAVILDSYEIEEEPKYYVVVEGPSTWINSVNGIFLYKENKRVFVGDNLAALNPEKKEYQFTEQEIKDYDPRFWAFAKPVEEIEND